MPIVQVERAGMLAAPLLNSVLSASCLLLAFALPALVVYYLSATSAHTLANKLGIAASLHASSAEFQFATWQRAAVIVCGAVPAGCMAYGLTCARRCFLSFSRGEYFTLQVVRGLRGFAAGVFFSGVSGLLAAPLLSALLTLADENRSTSMAFTVGSTQLLTLVFAGIVWQIAAVMTKAVAIAEENSQFV